MTEGNAALSSGAPKEPVAPAGPHKPVDPGAVVATRPEPVKAAERPAGLPEKFKTWEDMAKSYTELEKKIGAPKAPEQAKAPEAVKPAAEAPKAAEGTPEAKAAEAVATAGLDWSSLTKEVDTTGKLADESYAKLEKIGLPKAMVDDFIEGQKARGELVRTSIAQEIGGESVVNSLLGWIADSATDGKITQAELDTYNAAVSGRDKAAALAAVRAMHGRMISEVGVTPNLVRGGGSAGGDVYMSMREMAQDTGTVRYRTDPAERERVMAKLARSRLK